MLQQLHIAKTAALISPSTHTANENASARIPAGMRGGVTIRSVSFATPNTPTPALTAVSPSQLMLTESTAPMNAIYITDSEVLQMNNAIDFKTERIYQTTMHMAGELLSSGIITESDYHAIEEHFVSKYNPALGVLFSSLSLTKAA